MPNDLNLDELAAEARERVERNKHLSNGWDRLSALAILDLIAEVRRLQGELRREQRRGCRY